MMKRSVGYLLVGIRLGLVLQGIPVASLEAALDPQYRIDWKARKQEWLTKREERVKGAQALVNALQAMKEAGGTNHLPILVTDSHFVCEEHACHFNIAYGSREGKFETTSWGLQVPPTVDQLKEKLGKLGEEWKVVAAVLDREAWATIQSGRMPVMPSGMMRLSLTDHARPAGAKVVSVTSAPGLSLSLWAGDIVTHVESTPVGSKREFFEVMKRFSTATRVRVRAVRKQDGRESRVALLLPVDALRMESWFHAMVQSTLVDQAIMHAAQRLTGAMHSMEATRALSVEEFAVQFRPSMEWHETSEQPSVKMADPEFRSELSGTSFERWKREVGLIVLPAYPDERPFSVGATRADTLWILETLDAESGQWFSSLDENAKAKRLVTWRKALQEAYGFVASLTDEEYLAWSKQGEASVAAADPSPVPSPVWVGLTGAFERPAPPAKTSSGLRATSVTPSGPAAKAGLKVGDLILALEERLVTDQTSLDRMVQSYGPEARVKIRFARDGQEKTVLLTVEGLNPKR